MDNHNDITMLPASTSGVSLIDVKHAVSIGAEHLPDSRSAAAIREQIKARAGERSDWQTRPASIVTAIGVPRQSIKDLCQGALWVRAWWRHYKNAVEKTSPVAAAEIHDRMVDWSLLAHQIGGKMEMNLDETRIEAHAFGSGGVDFLATVPIAHLSLTREALRNRAGRQASAWTTNQDGLRDVAHLNQWRDNCRDEVRDEIQFHITDFAEREVLLRAWEEQFDGAVHLHDGQSNISDFRDVEPLSESTISELDIVREELTALCSHMGFLRSWWKKYGDSFREFDRSAAAKAHDHFIDGIGFANSIARAAKLDVDRAYIESYDWNKNDLPPAPDVIPSSQFQYAGGNLGLGYDHIEISIKVKRGTFRVPLASALRNIDNFVEPGRTKLLRGVAHCYDFDLMTVPA